MAPDEQTRLGAHAAPYMEPDGSLHNLRPIGRLAVSGADAPQRAADSEFGGMWFGSKPDTPPDPKTDTPVDTRTVAPAATPTPTDTPADTRTASSPAPQITDPAGTRVDVPVGPPAPGTALISGHEQGGSGPDEPPTGTPPGDEASSPAPVSTAERVVLDLDLSDLFKGVAITGQQPAVEDGRPEPQTAPVRARIDQRLATQRSSPAQAVPEPETVRSALSAADLEAIRWRLDGGTLREVVDDRNALRELGERLDGPLADEVDNVAKAGLLSVRAEVYRLLGELGMAAAASRLALAHAESEHDLQSEVIAQAELAHILRLRGDFKEADRLFAKATGSEVPEALRSVVHENAGRCCFDQGRHMEALDHFARAVRLGRTEDTDLAARVGVCLQAVYIHVLRDGWGPYPRTREEILGLGKPATGAGTAGALDEATAEQPVIRPR